MEKVMVYIAKDGTQFKDEKSCLSYEDTLPKYCGFEFTDNIGLFDVRDEIPLFSSVEKHNIEDSNMMYTDKKGIEELSCIMNVHGLEPNKICVYDYNECWWYDLEEIVNLYEKKTEELNKLLHEVGKLIKT